MQISSMFVHVYVYLTYQLDNVNTIFKKKKNSLHKLQTHSGEGKQILKGGLTVFSSVLQPCYFNQPA